jgi:hypothetical protein
MSDPDLYRAALVDPPRVRRIDRDPDGGTWVTWEIGGAAWAALEQAREPGESVEDVLHRVVRSYVRHLEQETSPPPGT